MKLIFFTKFLEVIGLKKVWQLCFCPCPNNSFKGQNHSICPLSFVCECLAWVTKYCWMELHVYEEDWTNKKWLFNFGIVFFGRSWWRHFQHLVWQLYFLNINVWHVIVLVYFLLKFLLKPVSWGFLRCWTFSIDHCETHWDCNSLCSVNLFSHIFV